MVLPILLYVLFHPGEICFRVYRIEHCWNSCAMDTGGRS
jgi:hypothetical protein